MSFGPPCGIEEYTFSIHIAKDIVFCGKRLDIIGKTSMGPCVRVHNATPGSDILKSGPSLNGNLCRQVVTQIDADDGTALAGLNVGPGKSIHKPGGLGQGHDIIGEGVDMTIVKRQVAFKSVGAMVIEVLGKHADSQLMLQSGSRGGHATMQFA